MGIDHGCNSSSCDTPLGAAGRHTCVTSTHPRCHPRCSGTELGRRSRGACWNESGRAAGARRQAFKNYDEAGNQRRIQCLKYLVLANMLMESQVDPFDAQEAKPYKVPARPPTSSLVWLQQQPRL